MSEASFVAIERVGGTSVARITCPVVSQREAPIIQQELLAAGAGVQWRLALDFRQVTMLTSLGLGMLVTLTREARDKKGRCVVFGLSKDLMDLVSLTKLDRFLTIAPDQAAALVKCE